MMETMTILLAVVLGLPAVTALTVAGIQWRHARARMRKWKQAMDRSAGDAEIERSARMLLAWADARQAQVRAGLASDLARPVDRARVLRARPDYAAPDAPGFDARRSLARREAIERPGTGFASVHLLLSDGAGHFFRVERRLCLN